MNKNLPIKLALLLCLVFSVARGQGIPDLFYYKFNGNGSSVPNLASSPPSGTSTGDLYGAMSQGSSAACGSGGLVGTGGASSSDYMSTNWAPSLSGSWTISFYTSNIGSSSTLFYIFGDVNSGGFRCFTNGVAGAGNWILRGTGLTDILVNGGATTSPNVTTFVYDASSGKGYGYLNGSLVTTTSQTTTFSLSGSGPFKVGSYATTNIGLPSGGVLDEFRFYNRALSASEVAKLLYTGSSTSTVNAKGCGATYKSPSGKYTWTTSGTYYDTIPNTVNCDSIITINLTFGTNTSSNINVTACDNYKSPSQKYKWLNSGIYKDTIPNAGGCDSVITINLTVKKSTTATLTASSCYMYNSPSGKYTWTTSGSYSDTIPNTAGCDSLITVKLTIKNASSSTFAATACDKYKSPSGKYTWTTSGSYKDTIPNGAGCDSFMTINLTMRYTSSSVINPVACDSYKMPGGKQTVTASGIYVDTIPNAAGCDSIITINLIVNKSSTATVSETACDIFKSYSGKRSWTISGMYKDTIPNASGCDSIITINLTVNRSSTGTASVTACDAYLSPSGKYTWTAAGLYKDTVMNAKGCDSIITITLKVNKSSTDSIAPVACGSYTSPSGMHTWTASGKYKDTLTNAKGCDSIITINLTVNTVDVNITRFGFVLTAAATGANYKWLDCNNNYAFITGETNQTFTVTNNGNYAVEVSQNNCTDTSNCISVTNVGIEKYNTANGISLYPNPSGGWVYLVSQAELQNATVKVINLLGETVLQKDDLNGKEIILDLTGHSPGIYFIEISAKGIENRIRLIKQ